MLILLILGIVVIATSQDSRQFRPCPNVKTFQYDEWDLKQQCPNMDLKSKITSPPPEKKCKYMKEPDFLFDDKKPDLLQMALNIMSKEKQQTPKKFPNSFSNKFPKRVDFKQKHEQEFQEYLRKKKEQQYKEDL